MVTFLGCFPGTASWEETPEQTQNLLKGLYILSGLEKGGIEADSRAEECLIFLPTLRPLQTDHGKINKTLYFPKYIFFLFLPYLMFLPVPV